MEAVTLFVKPLLQKCTGKLFDHSVRECVILSAAFSMLSTALMRRAMGLSPGTAHFSVHVRSAWELTPKHTNARHEKLIS